MPPHLLMVRASRCGSEKHDQCLVRVCARLPQQQTLHSNFGNRATISTIWAHSRNDISSHLECQSGYSSVGRASDCRLLQASDGPWFDSGWPDLLFKALSRTIVAIAAFAAAPCDSKASSMMLCARGSDSSRGEQTHLARRGLDRHPPHPQHAPI